MLRVLGFDVSVRPGFVLFCGLIVFLYQDAFGLWLAGALAAFTLIHELGHAVAARSAGAEADISLDFMAGYTSYRPAPGRPIGAWRRILISASGPLTQIVVSLAVLLVMGVDPLSTSSVTESDPALAIWWAGPVIGALNLIPVLPLDGGHLALTALDALIGPRSLRVMAIASLVLTGSVAVAMFASGRVGFVIFIAFLLVGQLQILQATSRRPRRRSAADDAETQAWRTGQPGMLDPGQQLSPWYRAHRALLAGDRDGAVRLVLDDLQATSPRRWRPPTAAPTNQLRAIVELLPDPLPHGNEYSERVLMEILLATGDPQRAGDYAVERFQRDRSSTAATMVARCSAALGNPENALGWLRAASEELASEPEQYADLLAITMDEAPEFAALRGLADFERLRPAGV